MIELGWLIGGEYEPWWSFFLNGGISGIGTGCEMARTVAIAGVDDDVVDLQVVMKSN